MICEWQCGMGGARLGTRDEAPFWCMINAEDRVYVLLLIMPPHPKLIKVYREPLCGPSQSVPQ